MLITAVCHGYKVVTTHFMVEAMWACGNAIKWLGDYQYEKVLIISSEIVHVTVIKYALFTVHYTA